MEPKSCGIFPDLHDSPEESVDSISTDFESFSNYSGVEGDDVAIQDIKHHISKGHLMAFDSEAELRVFLDGQEPVLNKIGIISKERAGIVKKRMILDTKVSGLKKCSAKHQRVLLPRLLDAVLGGLQLNAKCKNSEQMEWFVLDFSEAFWQVPLAASERRFFCAKLAIDGKEQFLVFLRTVQGQLLSYPILVKMSWCSGS